MEDTLKIKDIPNGEELTLPDGITEKIEFYSEGKVHCTKSKIPFKKSLVVLKTPEKITFSKSEEDNSYILDSQKIKAKISKKNGLISFLQKIQLFY